MVLKRKADPRTALFLAFILTFTVIGTPSLFQVIIVVLLVLSAFLQGEWLKGLKHLLVYLVFFSASYLINQYDVQKARSLQFLLYIVVRLFPVILAASMVAVYSPGEIAAGLSRMKAGRVILLPFIVALRFIPTLRIEMKQIRDAMHLRSLSFKSGYGFVHPLRTLRNIYVPLMFRCLQISDELGASAVTRGIDAPVKRSCARELRFSVFDYVLCAVISAAAAIYLIRPCALLVIPL